MSWLMVVLGVGLIFLSLWDGFEVMLLPRRINRRTRMAVLVARGMWGSWRRIAGIMQRGRRREYLLSIYGPLFMITLLAGWSLSIILGFSLVHSGLGTEVRAPESTPTFLTYLYVSGVTFFTLGYGDVIPITPLGRVLMFMEAGLGFGFLAVVIGYMPVLHQAFAQREDLIGTLDARAGSPPTAGVLLTRAAGAPDASAILAASLADWERWSAQLLETGLSFPTLFYYRSQHDNQSWLSAITCLMDTCAILIAGRPEKTSYQARMTFAMMRHALVDVSLMFHCPPRDCTWERAPEKLLDQLCDTVRAGGIELENCDEFEQRFAALREMYEPFAFALSERMLLTLPPVIRDEDKPDNWQLSAWRKRTVGIEELSTMDFLEPGPH